MSSLRFYLAALCAGFAASCASAAELKPDPPKNCRSCAEWNQPAEPYVLFGNSWYVGSAGLSSVLITSDQGHILIDGGLGQLSAALEGLKQVGQEQIPIMGLAKARGEKEERIFLPGRKNPIVLRPTSPATHLVQRIRDEAHRFAVTYHRNLRGKALLSSELDQIPGIGKIRRNRLLKQFGSLPQIASATDEQLRSAGLDAITVAALRKTLIPS